MNEWRLLALFLQISASQWSVSYSYFNVKSININSSSCFMASSVLSSSISTLDVILLFIVSGSGFWALGEFSAKTGLHIEQEFNIFLIDIFKSSIYLRYSNLDLSVHINLQGKCSMSSNNVADRPRKVKYGCGKVKSFGACLFTLTLE